VELAALRDDFDFDIAPDPAEAEALARLMGALAVRKLRLKGRLAVIQPRGWQLDATLGATVVQPCVVTLEPVTTRIEAPVERLYQADWVEPEAEEAESPEDDRIEALPEVLDLGALIEEALALALPLYPRAAGVELGEAIYTEPGAAPLTDEAARPFAGLKGLIDKADDPG
jgi:uncharacterized metal-binding protein YceD (DUF177 family)